MQKNQHKLDMFNENMKKDMKNSGFTPQQTQELNNILTLVEKAGNRQEHKRNTKMIEELRQNILELHGKIGELSNKKDNFSLSIIPKECNHDKQLSAIKEELDKVVFKS